MRRSKKDLDMESMFQKIMPSAADGKVKSPATLQETAAASLAPSADLPYPNALKEMPLAAAKGTGLADTAAQAVAVSGAKPKAKTKAAKASTDLSAATVPLTAALEAAAPVATAAMTFAEVPPATPAVPMATVAVAPAEAPAAPVANIAQAPTTPAVPMATVTVAPAEAPAAPVVNIAQAPTTPTAPVATVTVAPAEAPAAPVATATPVEEPVLVNLARTFVESRMNSAIEKFKCCKCEKCQLDVLAVALNKVPPQYVLLPQGAEPLAYVSSDLAREAVTGLVQSILHVKANPRH